MQILGYCVAGLIIAKETEELGAEASDWPPRTPAFRGHQNQELCTYGRKIIKYGLRNTNRLQRQKLQGINKSTEI